jgi:hypothetical protein
MSNATPPPSKIDKSWLLVAILFVGTLLYVIAVFWIGFGGIQHVREINAALSTNTGTAVSPGAAQPQAGQEPKAPVAYPISDFITQALLVIGTALATHLGAYLGISISDLNDGKLLSTTAEWRKYLSTPDGISGILAGTYFLTLVAAIIFWALTGFSIYAGKPLQDLAYSFLGVFAGAMAALSKGE